MYLRYREPSWESGDIAGPKPTSRPPSGIGSRRRQDATGSRPASRVSEPARGFPVIELHGVKLHAVTEAQVISHILGELDAGRGGVVVTPNLDHLRRYCHDLQFGALVAEADLVVADGMPLVWASRLQGTPLPERIPGSTLISTLTRAAAERRRSIFLLGGDAGTADGAARALREKYPSCIIAGVHFPPFGFQEDPAQKGAMIQALCDSKPDIVFVALGSPKQEKLIDNLRHVLPNAWWIGVGNSFSFLSGHVKRAPIWMQRIGLEWLHRLLQEPRRLFRRYLILGVPFATQLLGRAFLRGIPNRIRRRAAARLPAQSAPPVTARRSPEELRAAEATLTPAPAPAEPALPAPTVLSIAPAQPPAFSRLRSVVLLGGAVRSNALVAATGRAMLDLPLDENGSILNHWLRHAGDTARWASLDKLMVRVMVNQNAPEPRSGDPRFFGSFRVERDLSDYRGTGGLLHDMAADFDGDDLLLVANAAQVLLDPLPALAAALHHKGGDVTVVSHEDGTPSGIMLITAKVLRLIPPRGFVDMKEQALPLIASKYDVRVMHCRRPTGLPILSLSDYVQALRVHHRHAGGRPASNDPLAEDWGPSFAIVEPGAIVDPTARVHDSVVLSGARVEAGAVAVRSVVCRDGVVPRDRTAVDRLVPDPRDKKAETARWLKADAR